MQKDTNLLANGYCICNTIFTVKGKTTHRQGWPLGSAIPSDRCHNYTPFQRDIVMTTAIVTSLPTVSEFIELLDKHDWTYMHANGSAYSRGRDNWTSLKAIKSQDETLAAVFRAYNAFKDGHGEKPVADDYAIESVAELSVVENTVAAANDDDNSPEPTPIVMDFTRDAVLSLVNDGKFFGVEFIKRTTGELRQMQARIGVTKHLKGGAKKFDDASKNLLTVFSMDANGYRSIPIDAIQSLTVKGITYTPAESFAQAA